MEFGQVVRARYDIDVEHPMMVVGVRDDCPHHNPPPCLVLTELADTNPKEMDGWCYTLDKWELVDDHS